MARASFTDIQPLVGELLTQNDFIISFGVIPAAGMNQSKSVMLKCTTVALPLVEIEQLPVDIRGHKVIHRGIKKFGDNSFSCEFLVSGDTSLLGYNADSFNLIYNWMNFISDTVDGRAQPGKTKFFSGIDGYTQGRAKPLVKAALGGINPNVINRTKNAYSLDGVTLNIYNTKGDLTLKVLLEGVFPTSIEGLSFQNGQLEKQVLRIRATFAFDYFTVEDVLTTKALDFINKKVDRLLTSVKKKIPGPIKKLAPLI